MPNIIEIIIEGKDKFSEVSSHVQGEVKELEKHASNLGQTMRTGMGIAGAAAVGMGVAVAGGILKATQSFAEYGMEVGKVQRLTGESAQDASRLIFAAHETGIEYDTLTRAVSIFSKNMLIASEQDAGFTNSLTTNQKVLESLGVAALDASGNIRPTKDLLMELSEVFAHMPDGAEKTGLAMQLFGRSGAEMLPFLNKGKEGIAELNAEADKLGLTLSQKDVQAARDFTIANRELTEAIKGVEISVGKAAIPVLTELAKAFTQGLESGDNFVKFLKGAGYLIAAEWVNAMSAIANVIGSIFEKVINGIISGINYVSEKANSISNFLHVGDVAPTVGDYTYTKQSQINGMEALEKLFPSITEKGKAAADGMGEAGIGAQDFGKKAKSVAATLADGQNLVKSAISGFTSQQTREEAQLKLKSDQWQLAHDQQGDSGPVTKYDPNKGLPETAVRFSGSNGPLVNPGGGNQEAFYVNIMGKAISDFISGIGGGGGHQSKFSDEARDFTGGRHNVGEGDTEADKAKDINPYEQQLKILEDQRKIMGDNLALQDKTLLSADEQQKAYETLMDDVGNVSGRIKDTADNLHVSLIPGFDDLHKAAITSGAILDVLTAAADPAAKALTRVAGAAHKMADSAESVADRFTHLQLVGATGGVGTHDYTGGGGGADTGWDYNGDPNVDTTLHQQGFGVGP
jgi:hypothetical protein